MGTQEPYRRLEQFELDAGNLALDFANTMDWHASDDPVETIPSYMHLIAWAHQSGVIDDSEADHLAGEAARRPADANRALARTRAAREAMFRIFRARASGVAPEPRDLRLFNRSLRRALAHLQIDSNKGELTWSWADKDVELERPWWAVARAAADLMVSPEARRVRMCADERCGWLFVDTTRNRSRRWCSMESCGNRNKARRHYARARPQED